jgi:hypothetical protein
MVHRFHGLRHVEPLVPKDYEFLDDINPLVRNIEGHTELFCLGNHGQAEPSGCRTRPLGQNVDAPLNQNRQKKA